MIIFQHISPEDLEKPESGKWPAYVLFTLTVGVLLLLNWLGVWTELWGINTGVWLALLGGWRIFYNSISALFEKRVTAEIAIAVAVIAALLVGEYFAAAEAVFIMLVGEGLEEYASRRTRSAIQKLVELTPKTAHLKITNANGSEEREVKLTEVLSGDLVIVRPGERLPVDGQVVAGNSSVNEAPITGESLPVDKAPGAAVFAGSINTAGALEVRARRVGADTTLAQIIALIEAAEEKRAPVVRLADRYAKWFLPLLAVTAVATFYFTGDWLRTVAVLLVACPCALILATPAAVVAAIGRLARAGVLVKSGASLEAVAQADCLVFDKTGTLTEGRPVITQITSFNGHSENALLQIAALAEQRSEHAIAQLIVKEAHARGLAIAEAEEFKIDPGRGVEARAHGRRVVVGNRRLLEARQIELDEAAQAALNALEINGHSPVIVAENGAAQGAISVQDRLRDDAHQALHHLHHLGVKRIVMLTGDRERTARNIARAAGVDEVHAELLPQQKVELVERLKQQKLRVAMVGDGINDAPALACADVGIAMGMSGTDIAIEEADIVLMNDRLERLPLLLEVSRAAIKIIWQNIWIFAFAINLVSVAAAATGILGPAAAAAVHQVSALLVVLNSLRLLAYGKLKQNVWLKRGRSWAHAARHRAQHLAEDHLPRPSLHAAGHWLEQHRTQLSRRGLAALTLLYLLSGLTLSGPDELGVVQRFGQRRETSLAPGLHYRIPWPVEQVTRVKPERVQVAELGFRTLNQSAAQPTTGEPAAYEWNLQHRSGRYERQPEEALMLTGDENLIEVNAVVQYAIGSAGKFLFSSTDPNNLIRVAAEATLRLLIGQTTLDAVLTSGRAEIERKSKELIQAKLDEYDSGLRVVAVQLQDVHPSVEVVDAFRNVSSAFEEKNKLINEAEAYRSEQLALARGQALARLAEAAGYTAARANRAAGDAERFKQADEAFRRAPNVTETRLYLETIEQVLAGKKKLIIDASKFGRRQMFFLDPQGVPLDPSKLAPQP
jgi:HflK protein